MHEEDHEQQDLRRPEMWPDQCGEQSLVARNHAARLLPAVVEILQIVDERGSENIVHRRSRDVVGQRLIGVAIDHREGVRDQHRLAERQGTHGHRRG